MMLASLLLLLLRRMPVIFLDYDYDDVDVDDIDYDGVAVCCRLLRMFPVIFLDDDDVYIIHVPRLGHLPLLSLFFVLTNSLFFFLVVNRLRRIVEYFLCAVISVHVVLYVFPRVIL